MIRCFPDPYPDELFYSICARFKDRTNYPSDNKVLLELFGNKSTKAVVDLPSHLDKLVSALPPEAGYTSDYFIKNHTLLPYYAGFLPSERTKNLCDDMRGDRGSAVHMRAGVVGCLVPLPKWLRFCPCCVDDDKKQWGKSYWHRVHQAPGVEVCPIHQTFLQNSRIHARNMRRNAQFISAEHGVWMTQAHYLDLSKHTHQILLRIANDTAWLLKQSDFSFDFQALQARYRILLGERGLASRKGNIYVKKLLKEFEDFYSSEFLISLSCRVSGHVRFSWVIRTTHNSGHIQHPLHHLLLMYFLGHTVEEFFGGILPTEHTFFGQAPWPCLNSASDHYRQLRISSCEINCLYESGRHRKKPMGTFSCDCGFVYCRLGPDCSADDRFRYSKIESFGPIWEMALRQWWECPTISLNRMALKLGVPNRVIKSYAIELGLPFPRSKYTQLVLTALPRPKATDIPISETLEIYRTEWLSALKVNPEATLSELRRKVGKIYPWLYKHDLEWLQTHRPKSKKTRASLRYHADWKKRDLQFLKAAQDSVLRLISLPGRPIRLTIFGISRDMDLLPSMEAHISKLPITAQFLSKVVETAEMAAIRRIWWAVACYSQEQICPNRGEFVQRAGLMEAQRQWSKVRDVIDSALLALSSPEGDEELFRAYQRWLNLISQLCQSGLQSL